MVCHPRWLALDRFNSSVLIAILVLLPPANAAIKRNHFRQLPIRRQNAPLRPLNFVDAAPDGGEVRTEARAEARQSNTSGLLLKKLAAQLPFESFDAPSQRALGYAAALCCLPEVAFRAHRQEITDQ